MADENHPLRNPLKRNVRHPNKRSVFIKGGIIGNCVIFDSILACWVRDNERNGRKGVIIVDSLFGYSWGNYPGNAKGVQEIMEDLWGLKLFRVFDDGEDLHIVLWSRG